MSVPPKGNGLPKMGKELHMSRAKTSRAYALTIAGALAFELKGTRRAIKTVTKWTGASERTVKNWLSGRRGPSGQHLIALLGKSDVLLERILVLTGRGSLIDARRLDVLKKTLVEALAAIDAARN
jgi:hypothetical protein